MDPNVQVALISGAITILVGIITAYASFKGAVKGAKNQIEHEREILNKKEEEQRIFAESAIQQFVMREVRSNFDLILSKETMFSRLTEQYPQQYRYDFQLEFIEFNQFKHELIKSKSDLVERILLYYDVFYLLDRKDDLKDFNQNEFEELKKAFNTFTAKDFSQ